MDEPNRDAAHSAQERATTMLADLRELNQRLIAVNERLSDLRYQRRDERRSDRGFER